MDIIKNAIKEMEESNKQKYKPEFVWMIGYTDEELKSFGLDIDE